MQSRGGSDVALAVHIHLYLSLFPQTGWKSTRKHQKLKINDWAIAQRTELSVYSLPLYHVQVEGIEIKSSDRGIKQIKGHCKNMESCSLVKPYVQNHTRSVFKEHVIRRQGVTKTLSHVRNSSAGDSQCSKNSVSLYTK